MASKSKRKVRGIKAQVYEADLAARVEGPTKRKTWSLHDLRSLRPQTENQARAMEAWGRGQYVALLGSAGTGKTVLATYLAAREVLDVENDISRVVIVRSAVPSRKIGFLKGDLHEKLEIYEHPYHDAFSFLFGRRSTYDDMKAAGKVEFLSTSFARGLTLDNCVLILEEVQNYTFEEINTMLTRLGPNSRAILTVDTKQVDLDGKSDGESGLPKFIGIAKLMRDIDITIFTTNDIVRSGFVKQWLQAVEKYEGKKHDQGIGDRK